MTIGTTHVARGQRGDYDPSARPGDLTGRRLIANADAKVLRDNAIRETRNAMVGGTEALELVSLPAGRTFAIPAEVVRHLIQVGVQSD